MYAKKEGGIGYSGQLILLDGKEITYQQLMQLAKDDIIETHAILPESTGLEKKFGQKAKNRIWVLVSKKNPNYWDEFKKQLRHFIASIVLLCWEYCFFHYSFLVSK